MQLPQAMDAVRLASGMLLLLLIFVPLEKLFFVRPQKLLRPRFWQDVGYYFFNNLISVRAGLLLATMAGLALQPLAPSAWLAWVGQWPPPLRLVVAMVVADLGAYAAHRVLHAVPLLWRWHQVHHQPEQLDWLAHSRAHPAEIAFSRLCTYAPLYLLGLARSDGAGVDAMPLAVALLSGLWGYLLHANLRWRFGPLEGVLATPAFHHWHHANDGSATQAGNYAAMFPFIDRLFGTYRRESGWPTRYGVDEPAAPPCQRGTTTH